MLIFLMREIMSILKLTGEENVIVRGTVSLSLEDFCISFVAGSTCKLLHGHDGEIPILIYE
jgi:hypothetical protein